MMKHIILVLLLVSCTTKSKQINKDIVVGLVSEKQKSSIIPFHYAFLGVGKQLEKVDTIQVEYLDKNGNNLDFPVIDNESINKIVKWKLNPVWGLYHHRASYLREQMYYSKVKDGEFLEVLGNKFSLDSLFEKCLISSQMIPMPTYMDIVVGYEMWYEKDKYLILCGQDRIPLRSINRNFWLFFDITLPKKIRGYAFIDASEGNWECFHNYNKFHDFGYLERTFDNDTMWYYLLGDEGFTKNKKYYVITKLSEDLLNWKKEKGVLLGGDLIDTKASKWFFDIKHYYDSLGN
jgi:hypothetical protein